MSRQEKEMEHAALMEILAVHNWDVESTARDRMMASRGGRNTGWLDSWEAVLAEVKRIEGGV